MKKTFSAKDLIIAKLPDTQIICNVLYAVTYMTI